jgi:hypothetical protein
MKVRLSGVLTVLFGIAAFVLDGTAFGEDTWQRVTANDGSFNVEMPGQPKYSAQSQKTAKGSEYKMHQYLLEVDTRAFVIQAATYPKDLNLSNTRNNIQSGLDNSAKGMEGGKWTNIRWTTYQGLTASDAAGVRGGSSIRNFTVIKGRTIYTLTYGGPTDTAQGADANRFINSFLITK